MTTGALAEPDSGSVADRAAKRVAHQPALDGLRGVAVLLVLVYHHGLLKARPDGLRGGFLGVDVFFVLSGYLITSLLLAERSSTGGIAIGTFWARRARRLLPALFVLLLGAALYSATIAAPSELAQIRGDAIATLFYVQNWHLIAGNPLDAGSVLNHTWSLSVEEQWYIVWPVLLALLLAWKRVRPRRLFVVIVALAAASAIWTNVIYRSGAGVFHVYWGTDTRAQELLIGAALAVALRHFVTASSRRRPVIELAGLVGGCVVVAIVLRSTSGSAFFARGGYAIFAVAIAAVIAAAVQPAGAVIRPVLSATPLRWIGLISYGLYLFHWPLYFWLTPERTHTSGTTLLIVRVGVAIAAATASFLLIEQPIRRGALTGRKLRLAACVSLAVVLAATLLSTRGASTPTGADAATASPLLSSRMIATFRRSATEPGRRLLVVGHRLANQLQVVGGDYQVNGWNAMSIPFIDCGFLRGDLYVAHLGRAPEAQHCQQMPAAFQGMHNTFRPGAIVLMPDAQELYDREVGPYLLQVGSKPWANYATAQLDLAVRALTAPGPTPVILTNIPCIPEPATGTAFDAVMHEPVRRHAVNRFLATYADTHPKAVTLADLDGLLCPNNTPLQSADGRAMIDPRGTLTYDGAQYLWRWITEQVAGQQNGRP